MEVLPLKWNAVGITVVSEKCPVCNFQFGGQQARLSKGKVTSPKLLMFHQIYYSTISLLFSFITAVLFKTLIQVTDVENCEEHSLLKP